MSGDLDWTSARGGYRRPERGARAVQAFRRRAQAAGNLKTDDKQSVMIEKSSPSFRPIHR
jgi:hypothetical protein